MEGRIQRRNQGWNEDGELRLDLEVGLEDKQSFENV